MTLVVMAILLDAGLFLVALWGDALDHCQAAWPPIFYALPGRPCFPLDRSYAFDLTIVRPKKMPMIMLTLPTAMVDMRPA
jgi:hypothetical protein